MREKVGKSRSTVFFQWVVTPEGRKVKMFKTHHVRTTFEGSDVEKMHAVVAWSTFPSQNVQNTPLSDHFRSWDLPKCPSMVFCTFCFAPQRRALFLIEMPLWVLSQCMTDLEFRFSSNLRRSSSIADCAAILFATSQTMRVRPPPPPAL